MRPEDQLMAGLKSILHLAQRFARTDAPPDVDLRRWQEYAEQLARSVELELYRLGSDAALLERCAARVGPISLAVKEIRNLAQLIQTSPTEPALNQVAIRLPELARALDASHQLAQAYLSDSPTLAAKDDTADAFGIEPPTARSIQVKPES